VMALGVDWTAGIEAQRACKITLRLLMVLSEIGQGRGGLIGLPSSSEGECLDVQS